MLSKLYCSDPAAQFNSHKEEILEAVFKVCQKGSYVLGNEVEAFEAEFAKYNKSKYCVGVGSGTDAIFLALKSMNVGQGDEVITVSHTALATVAAIVMTGATPCLVDIEEKYYTIDPEKIEAAITNKTKAIVAVHLYGQPCDMDNILAIAKKYNLLVIEDCAQAHGAEYKQKKVGTFGHVGCFSFYPTKNLGAIGDGGGIITDDSLIAGNIRKMRQYGWDQNRISQMPGVLSRLDELQAAILRVKLRHLDFDNKKRFYIANQYKDILLNINNLLLPEIRANCDHVFHLYVVRSNNRNFYKHILRQNNIEAGIHYEYPVHLHPGYADRIKISTEGLFITEKVVKQILTLPIYPEFCISKVNFLREVNNV